MFFFEVFEFINTVRFDIQLSRRSWETAGVYWCVLVLVSRGFSAQVLQLGFFRVSPKSVRIFYSDTHTPRIPRMVWVPATNVLFQSTRVVFEKAKLKMKHGRADQCKKNMIMSTMCVCRMRSGD